MTCEGSGDPICTLACGVDIESIIKRIVRLLDAAEVGLMAEGGPAAPSLHVPNLSTPCLVVKHSTVENIFDVGVILFVNVLRRVQVKSVGESGVEGDEDGAPATAQNKYTSN